MIEYFVISLLISVNAWVFVNILMQPEMIFSWYDDLISKLPRWLYKPLGGCTYCLAGQMALWIYPYVSWGSYHLLDHILFIGLTIFFTKAFDTWIN